MSGGADIGLYALIFYWIGDNWKEEIVALRNREKKTILLLWFVGMALCMVLILLDKFGFYSFGVDMKYQEYNTILGGTIVPIFLFFLIWISSILISEIKGLCLAMSIIGKNSLAIMFLHMPVLEILKRRPVIGESKFLCFMIVMAVSICFSYIVKFNRITKKLFWGYREENTRSYRREIR